MFTKLSWRFVLYISERRSSLIMSKITKGIFKQKVRFRRYFLYFSYTFFVTLHIFPNSVIKLSDYSCDMFKTFFKYLYTGTINLSSIEDLLGEFVIIALSSAIYD